MAANGTRKTTKVQSSGLKRLLDLSTDSWLASYVDDHLVKSRTPRVDPGWFHPSELSTPCDRRLAFSYLGIPKKESGHTAKLLRIFHNGDWVHRRWQSYLRAFGLLIGREVKFEVDNPPIRGSADAVIRHPVSGNSSVVEIKSINSNGFSRLSTYRDDHFNQINIYMGALGIDEGHILYENKDTQDIKIFPVKHDKTRWEQVQFRLLKILRKMLKGEIPDIYVLPENGCAQCPYYWMCDTFRMKDYVRKHGN